ncbi:MAG: cytochrome c [Vicinamibacterales bacterium]
MTNAPAVSLSLAACLLFALGVIDLGAQPAPVAVGGASVFSIYCASCHGTSAKGDGPIASMLTPRPPDLTRLAQRAGGAFPAERVARTIDGRNPPKGHGGGDMPVWGDALAKSRVDGQSVELKIQQLVGYLEAIQVKP